LGAGTTEAAGLAAGTTGATGLAAGTTGAAGIEGLGREARVPIAAVAAPGGIVLFNNAAVASPVCSLAAAGAAPDSPANAFRGDLPMGGKDENNCPILLRQEFLC
jgi:hypothetical protein